MPSGAQIPNQNPLIQLNTNPRFTTLLISRITKKSQLIFGGIGEVSVRVVGALQLSSEIFDRCAQAASERREKLYF